MSSTVVIIPLDNNKDVAALVADMQPGQKLYTCGTIKALDDQTLTLRITEVTDKREDLPKYDDKEEDEDSDEEMEESNGSTEGESEESIELSAPGGYAGP